MYWSSATSLLADMLPQPVFVIDATGAIRLVNLAAERLLGVAREQLGARRLREFVPPARMERCDTLLAAALRGVRRRGEITLATAAGERVVWVFDLILLPDALLCVGITSHPDARDDVVVRLWGARVESIAAHCGLSQREREVLDELVLGGSLDEIARALRISTRTVRFHQANVLAKLGIKSRLELIRAILQRPVADAR